MSGTFHELNLTRGFLAAAARAPQKTAIVSDAKTLSYAELVERLRRVANGAASQQVHAGDRVALMAPNCPEYVELVLGLAGIGAAVVTLNPFLTMTELQDILDDSGARHLIYHPAAADAVADLNPSTIDWRCELGDAYEEWLADANPAALAEPAEETDGFAICYTSGTTGRPKGVVLSHRSRVLTFFAMAVEYGCYGPDDTALCIAPLFHGAGLAFALAPLFFGGSIRLMHAFDPEETLRIMADGSCTNVFMVPTHFHAIFSLPEPVRARYTFPTIKTIISNAAPLAQETKELIVEYFGADKLFECYGSTEGGIVCNLRPGDQLTKKSCVGLPFPCTEIALLDDDDRPVAAGDLGEIYVRSPYLFNGYWQQTATTAQSMREGWFSAGDLGRFDADGYLYIEGRKKDMIISGGVNVYPREIEECLHTHPDISEAAVVGIPDPRWGELVAAFYVPAGEAVDDVELTAFCAKALSKFKIPKRFVAVDAIPRNPSGKILKRVLRDNPGGAI